MLPIGETWSSVARMRTRKVIGTAIQEAREAAGLTQQELAAKVGVDRTTLAHWESPTSKTEPGAAAFKRLVAALDVPAESLLRPKVAA